MEFVEADCVAPAGDGAGGLVGFTGLVPGIFEGASVGMVARIVAAGWGCAEWV